MLRLIIHLSDEDFVILEKLTSGLGDELEGQRQMVISIA
jgi:hypothetical protein